MEIDAQKRKDSTIPKLGAPPKSKNISISNVMKANKAKNSDIEKSFLKVLKDYGIKIMRLM